jgi:hypothetical protein
LNGVVPNKKQYSVTPRAHTSMALVIGGALILLEGAGDEDNVDDD